MKLTMSRSFLFILFVLFIVLSPARYSSAGEVDKFYQTDKEGFVRNWLVAGPFPNEPETGKPLGYDADYLAGIGGESKARPYAGLVIKDVVFRADKGKLVAKVGATNAWGYTEDKTIDVVWKEIYNKETSPIMNLNSLHKDFADYYVSYLAAYVECPDERDVQIGIGSDDGFKLWVNGKLSGEFAGCRPAVIDDNLVKVHFIKGMNRILLKVMDLTGDSGAVVKIADGAGKPAVGLKVHLELPEHRYQKHCKNIGRVDIVDGKVFGTVLLGDFPFFAGENTLDIRLGCQETAQAKVAIRIKGPDGKTAWEQTSAAGLKLENAWFFKKPVSLTSAGRYGVTVTVTTLQGTILGTLVKGFDLVDFGQLKEQNKELQRKTRSQKGQLVQLTAHFQKIQSALKQKKATVDQGYERLAQKYADERNKFITQHGPSAKSVDEPFVPAGGLRSTLCINGDQWEIAAAKSTGRSSVDESYIPTTGWEPITVPTFGIEYYFRGRQWPMKGGENLRYAPASQALDTQRACGFTINEGRENNAMYLRTRFTLPKDWSGKRLLICTDRAEYKIKIWLNGTLASEGLYGWMAPLQADLTKYVKPGVNTLMVYAGRAWLYGEGQTEETWGLQGDVYLKSVPQVYVDDTWIIPHWRTATLETRTFITNTTDQPQKVTLNQKAILNGWIRRDFGNTVVEVPANTTIEVKQEKPWTDPECWEVGKPVLYQLASTLIQNGVPADQHFQRFGYREFWKSKFDYWLNGKRFFIQGDVVDNIPSPTRQYMTLFFSLLRNTSNINTIRAHTDRPQSLYATVCDELGMLFIPNMYPSLDGLPKEIGPNDVENFKKSKWHQFNIRRYTNWIKWLRNHPSIVIYSTDNEVFTQAWPKPWDDDIRNDRIAALYEPLVKSLDPSRLVTRDGDQGTWGKTGAWQQQPADVANYHYPEFDSIHCIHDWQSVYEKPVLYGETLYCSYGAWDNWIGAKPSQVITSASRARTFLSLYRDLEVSGWVGMGIGHNGFIENKPGGTPFDAMPKPKPKETNTWYAQGKIFPGMRLRWPSQSGPGFKQEFGTGPNGCYGNSAINWYIPGYPGCVLNAVNTAYKESTWPMPEAPKTRAPEVIYQIVKDGKPMSGAMVFLTPANGQGTEPIGIWCDKEGKAWFVLREPGEYLLSVEGTTFQQKVKVAPLPNDLKPGLEYMPQVKIEIKG